MKDEPPEVTLYFKAMGVIRTWSEEGRSVPGYTYGQTGRYLGELTGIPFSYSDPMHVFVNAYKASGSNLMEGITGPNGWTFFQAYLIKKGIKT